MYKWFKTWWNKDKNRSRLYVTMSSSTSPDMRAGYEGNVVVTVFYGVIENWISTLHGECPLITLPEHQYVGFSKLIDESYTCTPVDLPYIIKRYEGKYSKLNWEWV
jgi:hypothetical protein